MADGFTTNYNLVKPEVGGSDDEWGEKINSNFDILDQAVKTASELPPAEYITESELTTILTGYTTDAELAGVVSAQDTRDDAQDAALASALVTQDTRDDAQDARDDAQDIAIAGKVPEAPNDGKVYGRKSLGWVEEVGTGGEIETSEWTFSSTITAPPTSGQVRLNNATQASATHIFLSGNTVTGVNVNVILKYMLKYGSKVYIQDKANSANYIVFDVTADAVVASGYADITGTVIQSGGTIPAQRVTIAILSGGGGGSSVFIQDTPPTGVPANSLWWESDTGLLYVNYNDGDSTQWVMAQPVADATLYAVRYDQAQSLTAAQKAQARANIDALKKNYILNGAMQVSQQNGSTVGTLSGYYPVDMFYPSFGHAGAITVAQVASATPGGSPNRVRITVTTADASVAAGDYFYFGHVLEGYKAADLGYGVASPKMATLQFGVKAPAGIYCVVFLNSGSTRSYVAEYTIAAGEANTDVVKSVQIPGDATGTWLKDNSGGIYIRWGLMAGSTFQQAAGAWGTTNALGSVNQFNFMGTVGNVFELFDVGLYEGTVAPAFQVPDYASELLLCKRYWRILQSGSWRKYVSNVLRDPIPVVPPMRVAATLTKNTVGATGLAADNTVMSLVDFYIIDVQFTGGGAGVIDISNYAIFADARL